MIRNNQKTALIGVGVLGFVVLLGSWATAQSPTEGGPAAPPQIQLPPGWTEADMQACMLAGTPGEMQERLAKQAGVWRGQSTMWMSPVAEPITSECTMTVTPIMDGRYIRVEMAGETPGMGPYSGLGIYGFDNVSQKFVSTWIDSHSTGILRGEGDLSADGNTLTWSFTYNCPITKKPAVLREVETTTGPDSKTLETFASDPKTGEEFRMMSIELKKQAHSPTAAE